MLLHLRSLPFGASVPSELWTLIRDPTKNPTPAEKEVLRANQLLYDAIIIAEVKWQASQSENPMDFTSTPIEFSILEDERYFEHTRRPINQIVIQVEESLEEGSNVRNDIGSDIELIALLVVSLDSIAQNADFIHL